MILDLHVVVNKINSLSIICEVLYYTKITRFYAINLFTV